MVDEGRVARLLRAVDDRVDRLQRAAAAPATERTELWLDGVKYLFITAIEACIDTAQHVCSSERWAAPDSNAGAMRQLLEHGVLTPATGEAMARATGFRNVLVHRYVDVDDGVVIAALDRLGDLRAFVADVAAWLTAGDSP